MIPVSPLPMPTFGLRVLAESLGIALAILMALWALSAVAL